MTLESMNLSPNSEDYLSQGTENEPPFALERYRSLLEQEPPSPTPHNHRYSDPLQQPPITNMEVDGAGLRALGEITIKAEHAADEIVLEIVSTRFSKFKKCLVSGKVRPFIEALHDVDNIIAVTAEEVCNNHELFKSIESGRTKVAYKQLCKAIRGISMALSKMTAQCGHEKFIRACRKFVVRVLRKIIYHFALVVGMERVVERVWAGPRRYGDDVNAGSLLKARVVDWLNLEPRFMDKMLCRGPDRILRRREQGEDKI